jgi:hypothetical protein
LHRVVASCGGSQRFAWRRVACHIRAPAVARCRSRSSHGTAATRRLCHASLLAVVAACGCGHQRDQQISECGLPSSAAQARPRARRKGQLARPGAICQYNICLRRPRRTRSTPIRGHVGAAVEECVHDEHLPSRCSEVKRGIEAPCLILAVHNICRHMYRQSATTAHVYVVVTAEGAELLRLRLVRVRGEPNLRFGPDVGRATPSSPRNLLGASHWPVSSPPFRTQPSMPPAPPAAQDASGPTIAPEISPERRVWTSIAGPTLEWEPSEKRDAWG